MSDATMSFQMKSVYLRQCSVKRRKKNSASHGLSNVITLYKSLKLCTVIPPIYKAVGRDGHDFDFKIKIMILKSKS